MDQSALLQSPIPGESLANDPDQPYPFEQAPQFTDVQKAQEYLFEQLVDQNKIPQLLDIINQGVPLTMIAQAVLFAGFQQGKWNPDLFLLLLEPTVYILLFICEQSGVDYILDPDETTSLGSENDHNVMRSAMNGGTLGRMLGIDPKLAKDKLPQAIIDKVGSKVFGETQSAPTGASPASEGSLLGGSV